MQLKASWFAILASDKLNAFAVICLIVNVSILMVVFPMAANSANFASVLRQ